MLVTSIAAKAWEVGDYYNLDGVPSIVVWVDSTGEHGLRMTPNATSLETKTTDNMFYKKDSKKKNKERWIKNHEQYEEIIAWRNNNLWNNKKKVGGSISIEKLLQSNCEYGEINMKAVIDFCERNNIDMEAYFPSYYWATNIGSSWFIPGAYEANLISKILADSIGVTRDAISWGHEVQKYAEKSGDVYFNFIKVFNIDLLLTSTLILSDWAQDPSNEDMIGLVEVPDSEKNGGWFDYKTLYKKNAQEYRGDESKISLELMKIQRVPPFSKMILYYLLMRNSFSGYISAVAYF